MATSIIKKIIYLLPFSLVTAFIILLLGVTFFALSSHSDFNSFLNLSQDSYIQYVIGFTLWQATLSTILSIALAILIARSLHRRSGFIGRGLILNFLNLAFILPAITLVTGIAIIHGKNGWINKLLENIHDQSLGYYLYGIFGIMLGHLAFCIPFAVRVFLSRLESIPDEMWRLTSQLELSTVNIFKIIEWPYLRLSVIGVAILTFMMCFSSFVIVLVLGGGPAATTLEVEIYHSLKFDFDLPRAINLSFIQFLICICLTIFIQKSNTQFFPMITNISKRFFRPDINKVSTILIDLMAILLLFILSLLPVIAIIISGFNNKLVPVLYSKEFWYSAKESLEIALYSGGLTLFIALGLISGAFYFRYHLNKPNFSKHIIWLSNIRLIMPAFVFITGLFIAMKGFTPITNIAFYLIILVNSIAALPFAVNILLPGSLNFNTQEIYLCQSLGINGWNFIKFIYWPRIRKSLSYALALSVTISWGDLNLIALFGSNNLSTLPYLLYNMMSTYRVEEAAVVALAILLSSFFLFWVIEEFLGGEINVRT